jgi:lipopolysaccharide export LptBFGC system permease protein LptF
MRTIAKGLFPVELEGEGIWKFALPTLVPIFALLSILFFSRSRRAPPPAHVNVFFTL